jgi:hypothetical protein
LIAVTIDCRQYKLSPHYTITLSPSSTRRNMPGKSSWTKAEDDILIEQVPKHQDPKKANARNLNGVDWQKIYPFLPGTCRFFYSTHPM